MSAKRAGSDRAAHRRATIARARLELRRSRRAAVIVALAVIVAWVSAASLIGRLSGGSPLASRDVIQVAIDDAKAVEPGKNELRWVGIPVGRVTDAELDGDRAVLTAKLDTGKAGTLYRDARLRLRPQTPLNDMYLDIVDPGDPVAGPLTDDEVLEVERARSPVDIAEVLNVFSEDVGDRLEQALDELSVGLPDGGEQLRFALAETVPFLEATERLGDTIAARERVVRKLISRLGEITGELAARDRMITRLVRAGGETFAELGEHRADIDRTLTELPSTLTQMESSFTELETTLAVTRPALAALRPAARALPEGLEALESLAAELDPALTAARPAVRALTPLARQLAPTSTALAGAFRRLEPQLPRLDRITENVTRCELSLQKFFAWNLSVFKFGNRSNFTASPRGDTVATAADATDGADPTLVGAIGCADGRPPG